MRRAESLNVTAAVKAMQSANFPLLENREGVDFTVITNRESYGREGLLPVELFQPKAFNMRNVHQGTINAANPWQSNIHAGAVLKATLGEYGERAISHVLGESLLLAGHQHEATKVVTASRLLAEGETTPSVLFAVWDNGKQYVSPQHMEYTFSEDSFGTLNGERRFPVTDKNVGPTLIAKTALDTFGGELAVYSGENKMEIVRGANEYAFQFTKIAPIVGNLLVSRLYPSSD